MVIDCAAQPSAIAGYQRPGFDLSNNTFGTMNVLARCREWGAGILFFSTNKTYPVKGVACYTYPIPGEKTYEGQPVPETCPLDGGDRSIYGVSKVMADLAIQEYGESFGIPYICNRWSCLAGEWQWGVSDQGWVMHWMISHVLGLPLKYIGWGGKQVRDVLFIPDICRLVETQIEAVRNEPKRYSGAYNVGGGMDNACSLIQMTDLCRDITGNEVPISIEAEPRRADFAYYVSDITKVSTTFHWYPRVGLRAGVVEIYRWTQDHLDLLRQMYGRA
jgi:CDP-paratose 2-epimerase